MADLFLIVPASANIIGKVANGIADDMLSTTIMATTAPVIFAPAMNTNMYKNPIVQGNIRKLREYNYLFIEPDKGMLACGDIGSGKLPSTKDIVESTKGENIMKVVITAGGTSEKIDNVRKITNSSTGKLGLCIANEFLKTVEDVEITYICSKETFCPNDDRIKIKRIIGVDDLEREVRNVLENNDIDVFIHLLVI